MSTSEKYLVIDGKFFIRKPNSDLLQMTEEDWKRHKTADELIERTPEYIAAHGPINPVRGREVKEQFTHPALRQATTEDARDGNES